MSRQEEGMALSWDPYIGVSEETFERLPPEVRSLSRGHQRNGDVTSVTEVDGLDVEPSQVMSFRHLMDPRRLGARFGKPARGSDDEVIAEKRRQSTPVLVDDSLEHPRLEGRDVRCHVPSVPECRCQVPDTFVSAASAGRIAIGMGPPREHICGAALLPSPMWPNGGSSRRRGSALPYHSPKPAGMPRASTSSPLHLPRLQRAQAPPCHDRKRDRDRRRLHVERQVDDPGPAKGRRLRCLDHQELLRRACCEQDDVARSR